MVIPAELIAEVLLLVGLCFALLEIFSLRRILKDRKDKIDQMSEELLKISGRQHRILEKLDLEKNSNADE